MYRCNRSYADLVFAHLGVLPFLFRSLTNSAFQPQNLHLLKANPQQLNLNRN